MPTSLEFDRTDRKRFPCAECMVQHAAKQTTPECMEVIVSDKLELYPDDDKMTTSNGQSVEIRGICDAVEDLMDSDRRVSTYYGRKIPMQDGQSVTPLESEVIEKTGTEAINELWDRGVSLGTPTKEELDVLKGLVVLAGRPTKAGSSKPVSPKQKNDQIATFSLFLSCFDGGELTMLYGHRRANVVYKQLTSMMNKIGKELLKMVQALRQNQIWQGKKFLPKEIQRLNVIRNRIKKAQEREKNRREYHPYYLHLPNGNQVIVLKHYKMNGFKLRDGSTFTDAGIIYTNPGRTQWWELSQGIIAFNYKKTKQGTTIETKVSPKWESSKKKSKDLSTSRFKSLWLGVIGDNIEEEK